MYRVFYLALARPAAYVDIPHAEKQCCVLGKDIYKVKNEVDRVCFSSNNNWQAECYVN